jgi:hypothetical protein
MEYEFDFVVSGIKEFQAQALMDLIIQWAELHNATVSGSFGPAKDNSNGRQDDDQN